MNDLSSSLDPKILRKAFGRFPSGVIGLCALVDGKPVGMAVSSFTSVSLDPALVSVCVSVTSGTWPLLRQCTRLGLSVLSSGHEMASRQLASRSSDRFGGIDWFASGDGAVFINGAAAWLECDLFQEVRAGDHDIVLLAIHTHSIAPDAMPLVFHDSGYRLLAGCPVPGPGAGADDAQARPASPTCP